MSLVDLVIAVHGALDAAGLPHAFGGALALAYVAEPRGTVDVDVNVFVRVDAVEVVGGALATIGLRPPEDAAEPWLSMAGVRFRGPSAYPVDVFLSLAEQYDEVATRCVRHPFGPAGALVPFLSAEDVALFKLSFGRDKDWVDLRAIVASRPDLDLEYVERQLVSLRGPTMHPRLARIRALARQARST